MTEHLDKKEFEEWRKRVEQNIRLMASVERRMEKKLDELMNQFGLFRQSVKNQLAAAETDIRENKEKIVGIEVNIMGSEKDGVKGLNTRMAIVEDFLGELKRVRVSLMIGVIMLFINLILMGYAHLVK